MAKPVHCPLKEQQTIVTYYVGWNVVSSFYDLSCLLQNVVFIISNICFHSSLALNKKYMLIKHHYRNVANWK